jgi:4-oxalmesaconate hydratase
MIIDVHGHYTTAPRQLSAWRQRQIASAGTPFTEELVITDDEIRETIIEGQLKLQNERGTDLALFSPTAGGMAHHYGDEETSKQWTRTVNDLVHRVAQLFPENFIGVCQIPQSPGISPANCIDELERCVNEYGFVGLNLNPDPTDGYWTGAPMTDRFWYPLYEKMEELEVPAMIHVSMSCNPNFHGTGAHYLNGDTSVFMQLIQYNNIFKDFPNLKFVIPHGGGAVPYHWGRYRGICEQLNNDEDLVERLMNNVYFDTCVYHHAGVKFLIDVIGVQNVIFASEMIGAVRSRNPRDGNNYYDDTKRYVDAITTLSDADRQTLFEGNARKVYPRLDRALTKAGK